MGLLKKKKKKPFKMKGGGATGGAQSSLRPKQVEKLAPCIANCPSGNDIRGWITTIAQHEKSKISLDEAHTRAWNNIVQTNPFPSVMGRVCPHPCETNCNRTHKDGAVSINAAERFIGDWGIEQGLKLSRIESEGDKEESVGVIGAGPAGLSFAYQMVRRGYKATVYEKTANAGGMVYWGIPFYRQPAEVLDKEVQRIVDLGVELKLNCEVGKDISVDELKAKHKVIFLAPGAHKGRKLRIPGEDGPGLFTGTGYLYSINNGEQVDVGKSAAIIGGGDTAIDAARAAKRAGADATILYRRTREEMPAIDSEIEDALKEGVKIDFLVAPVEVKRDGDKISSVVVQKMELGEPDESGRRRPVPIEGSEYEIEIDSIVAAISQDTDWDPLGDLQPKTKWLEPDKFGKVEDGLYAGGDVVNLGLATIAVGQGRMAAEAIHAELRGSDAPPDDLRPPIGKERIKMEAEDVYPTSKPAERSHRPVEEWLTKADDEIDLGITAQQFEEELKRCFSCGLCFGCERCWMFCTPSCFVKVDDSGPGNYYTIKLETCDGCKKCDDECPCGFIDMQ
ncbi:MAG: FAD-dependent oxidoreductase [Deltaproteobacteria bacterium]|nr:FAD-dependent oxidoreductase [Deltaproteobacteria bacterium]